MQQFPRELMSKMAALGLLGIQFPEQYGGAGMSALDYCICIEEIARVDPSDFALAGGAQRPLLVPYFTVRHRRAEAAVPRAAGARREARRVGADRIDVRQRRRQHAHDRDARRRRLGAQRFEDLHHARQRRRRHGRDGGHRPRRRSQGHLRVHRRTPDAGDGGGEEGRQAGDARERHERGVVRALPDSRGSAPRRGGAGLRQHDAGARRRAHRHRRARRRAGAGRVRGGAALRARTQVVRQADRRLPGDSVEARRRRHARSRRRVC